MTKFYQLTPKQRREQLLERGLLANLAMPKVDLNLLDTLSENVIGKITLPLSVVTDVEINQQSYQIVMTSEEPSVVAAANHGTRIFNKAGGVVVTQQRTGIYGQAFLRVAQDFSLSKFEMEIPEIITALNQEFSSLVAHGGGVRQLEAYLAEEMLELQLLVDPAEAMGANKINSILEYLCKLLLEREAVQEKLFAILSNYPSQLATAQVEIPVVDLLPGVDVKQGLAVAQKIALLSEIGQNNVLRAPTNNKGIMNGVDAVLLATGNDFRAVETAAQQYASRSGKYRSLSQWHVENDKLIGELTLPLPLGVVGGSINSRPDVQEAYQIMQQPTAAELAAMMVTIGLANNLAALLAISSQGIQAGHMRLQLRQKVRELSGSDELRDEIVTAIMDSQDYSTANINKIIKQIRG